VVLVVSEGWNLRVWRRCLWRKVTVFGLAGHCLIHDIWIMDFY
jgi:hypothetical protein